MQVKKIIRLVASGVAGGFLGGFLWGLFFTLIYGRGFGFFVVPVPLVISPSCGLIIALLIHFINNKMYLPLTIKILIGVLVAAIPVMLIFGKSEAGVLPVIFWLPILSFAVFVGTTTILVAFKKNADS
jgi:hypothetical protein